MEKIINIDGRDVKFKATAAFLLRYKMYFKRDALQDLLKLAESFDAETKTVENPELFDTEVLFRYAWVLAKAANNDIPEMVEWLDQFEEFPLESVMGQIMELIQGSLKMQAKSKKK